MAAPSGPVSGVGSMRCRLTLQRIPAASARDAYGHVPRGDFADVATFWGSIRQVSAREAVNADRLKATATHMIRARYVTYINPATDRLKFADPHTSAVRHFNVEIANNVDERHREWEIYAVEVKNPAQ